MLTTRCCAATRALGSRLASRALRLPASRGLATAASRNGKTLRSQEWFDNPDNPGMTALYLERYLNFGLTREEMQSGRPIIGIAQTGSDLSPCNRVHVSLADRLRDGIRDAGGLPLEFPCHPIQETGRRPTAALDRNLAYLSLLEVLHGYPLDGVILTTGCDKTTPATLMAAAQADLPAIVSSGGPMLDGHWDGELAGSGSVIWTSRRMLAAGEIDDDEFFERVCSSAPSVGHCNTMGTASTMNIMAEALGMSLTGCAAIPAAYRERAQMAYRTGRRAVELVREDLRPSDILTREAFLNAIRVNTAIGGSTNAPPHLQAIANHAGVQLSIADWQQHGYAVPLLADVQPAGRYLMEKFHRAGGVPAVMGELLSAGVLDAAPLTVSGKSMGENLKEKATATTDVIRTCAEPMRHDAGFVIISGNLFSSALLKTSVISPEFRQKYLSDPEKPGVFEARAIVFDGPEDYHDRLNDPSLAIDEECILFIRNVGPIGYPGSAEVVNMQPPDHLIEAGIQHLPTVGDGRQSGTSESPSILNASPEAAAGGGLAILQTNDKVLLDVENGKLDLLASDEEIAARWASHTPYPIENQSPWQELYRAHVGQLEFGGCLEMACKYQRICGRGKQVARDNH